MTKRTDHLDLARTDLAHIADTLAIAEHRMMDARPGLPGAANYDGPTGGTSDLTPTEAAADRRIQGDRTQADINQLDKSLREIARHALILRRLVDSWTPHHATDRDRRAVERANLTPEPGCEHHASLDSWQPVHRTSTVAGNLTQPMALCRWCYDRTRDDGRLPTADRLQRDIEGRRDSVRA